LLAIALLETESAQATTLSEKVASAVFPTGHVADRFMSFAKYGEPHSGVLITKFDRVGLAVSDDLGTHRLDTLVVASLKCRSPKSTAEGILSLEGLYWEETSIEKGRVSFRLRGNVIYSCSTRETLYAQIRIGLRFELDPEDIDRLFSGFGLFGDLKWVPTLTSVDLFQIR
jgi:hypothetical protein